MKKILFIATTPFAVNAFLIGHLLALSKLYEVVVLTNLSKHNISPQLQKNIRVVDLNITRKISLLADLKSLIALLIIFLREKPDAIHSITPKAGLLSMIAGFLAFTPRRFHTFTGQVWATKKEFLRVVLKSMDRIIVQLGTRTFADSPSQIRFLEEQHIAKPNVLSVLGKASISGVDLQRFHPSTLSRSECRNDHNSEDTTCVFLFLGRITKDKGVIDAIDAMSRLSLKDEHSELWIVGPDEENLIAKYTEADIDDKFQFKFLGPTDRPEFFMASADVLILPSYREGFGSVIIEAAACGIPTIAYKIDGVVDAIDDGVTGRMIEVGNITELGSEMQKMCVDPMQRKLMGEQARERVTAEFSSEIITEAWVAFYKKELSKAA